MYQIQKSGYFTDLFRIYGWLKNPAIWLAKNILAHLSRTKNFPNMGFVQKHIKKQILIITDQIQEKLMTKCSNKLKKPCFWTILGPFYQLLWGNIFLESPALPGTTSYGFLATWQNFAKINDAVPKNPLDRQKARRKAWRTGQTDPIL